MRIGYYEVVSVVTKEKVPEDLGVKVGTKEQVIWEKVLKDLENSIARGEEDILVQKAFMDVCLKKIEAEKKKL